MADLSQLLAGATLTVTGDPSGTPDEFLVGQVISAGGEAYTMNTPEFSDCDNDQRTVLLGLATRGALDVTCIYDSRHANDDGATGKLLALANQDRGDAEIKAEFAFADGSNLTANPAVITTLSINGGDAEDRITVNLSIMPTDESDWTWAAV